MRWHNLGDLIDRKSNLDKEAIIDLALPGQPRTYTHRQIDRLANGVAAYLISRGFTRGTHVAIVSLNRAEYVAAYFGIMRASLVAVPVNIKVARDTIDYVMDDAKVALAFVDAANRRQVREGIPLIDFDDAGPDGSPRPSSPSSPSRAWWPLPTKSARCSTRRARPAGRKACRCHITASSGRCRPAPAGR